MPLIEWNDAMSVGVQEFDSHHKKLIMLANRLYDAIAEKREDSIIEEVVTEISNYTIYHFFAEENLMQMHGYPGYAQHEAEHLELTKETLGLLEELRQHKPGIGQDVLAFLKKWLSHHIFGTDKLYAPFFMNKGIK